MFFEDRKQVVCVRHTGGVATLVLGAEGGLGIKGKQNGRRMLHGIHDECLKVRRQSTHPLQMKFNVHYVLKG